MSYVFNCYSCRCAFVFLVIVFAAQCDAGQGQLNDTRESVLIKPLANIKYFDLPTSEQTIVSWMDVERGVFPNTSSIASALKVGDPVTIFIYLKDASNLYDIKITDCWAYDSEDRNSSKNTLHLTKGPEDDQNDDNNLNNRLIKKWNKYVFPKEDDMRVFLYAQISSFKFPEKDQVYITCDVELCLFKVCNRDNTKPNPNRLQ